MSEYHLNYPLIIFLVGGVILLVMLIKPGLERLGVPALVGFLVLGFLIRLADTRFDLFTAGYSQIFTFMANIGLITLLFRVGLESNIRGLAGQLRRAGIVWFGNVFISGPVGFFTAWGLLGFHWVTSLIVATAFTATSVGITVAVWKEAEVLDTPQGQLLVDVAEMDDISAVVLMAILFAIIPTLRSGTAASLFPLVSGTLGLFLLKLLAFGAFCFLFSQYVERHVVHFFGNLESRPDLMLVVVAIGFVIAALAGALGFSLAIGAFFAGLVFSRDPETLKMESSFLPLYSLFSPFFFIGIGMDLDPAVLGTTLGIGGILLVMAVLGKFIANALPLFFMTGVSTAVLIGFSMVPRAEIAMVIMQRGLDLGDWAVPGDAYAAMVVVSAATCILSPLLLRWLLKRQFPEGEKKG